MTPSRRARSRALVAAALALAAAPPLHAQADARADAPAASPTAAVASPLADVEHWTLANGARVWLLRTPGARTVAADVVVAAGADREPRTRAGVAHLLEHVQFGDRDGRTEAQLNGEMDALGVVVNGHTTPDATTYSAVAPAAHATTAIRWLGRLVLPLPITPAVVDRERGPLGLELRSRAPSLPERLLAAWAGPAAVRPPGEWRRAFGLDDERDAAAAARRDLGRLTSDDLLRFRRAFYVPALVTLVVVGDVPRDSVAAAAAATLGTLAPAAAPPPLRVATRGGFRREVSWKAHSYTLYRATFAFAGLSADDRAMLAVVRALLEKRLDDRLRYGARKLAYHPDVVLELRGAVARLTIGVQTTNADVGAVRDAVHAELARLGSGAEPAAELASDARLVGARLAAELAQPGAAEGALRVLGATTPADAPPDPVRLAAALTPATLAAFIGPRFTAAHELERINRPLPNPALLALAALLVAAAVVAVARRRLVRQLDMRRIRYVARIRVPAPYAALCVALFALVAAAVGRALWLVGEWTWAGALAGVDHFAAHALAFGALFALAVALAVLALSRVPRKLLVFEDGAAIKYLSYRSEPVARGDVDELAALGARDVWFTRRAGGAALMAVGLARPAIYLRRRGGPAWYFATRDGAEALAVLRERLGPVDEPRGAPDEATCQTTR